MIISDTTLPSFEEFSDLVKATNAQLNLDAKVRPDFYKSKDGKKLEIVVKDVMEQQAQGTPFNGCIQLVSGQRFPDIIAKRYYGLEVKSSTQDHWITTGNSVLESTRVEDVEHIFLLFGKLSGNIEFKARRYQDCLSDVVVTHYPRYRINMDLAEGSTIFDKMNIDYDEMRKLQNPITPVVSYYKNKLKDGESLWWIDNVESDQSAQVPMTVRLWRTLSIEEKEYFTVKGLVYFPELFTSNPHKYDRFTLWLVTQHAIVSTSARDSFSAGGQVEIAQHRIPHIYSKVFEYKELIVKELLVLSSDYHSLHLTLDTKNIHTKINTWIDTIAKHSTLGNKIANEVLRDIFKEYL